MPKKRNMVPITELRIRVYRPLDERDPCFAYIGNLPMRFSGKTPMAAKRAADEWRTKEVAKETERKANADKSKATAK